MQTGVDWHLVVDIAIPILTLFLGAWVKRWFEKRPNLVSYYGHVSAFKYTLPNGTQTDIYTHSVILRNAGRKAASNVRLSHYTLPDFNIFPAVSHSVVPLVGTNKDIVLPTMVPGEQLTISYLYFPPLTYAGVNAGIKCDEGFARQIPVLVQRQYPTWFNVTVGVLMLTGIVTALYFAIEAIRRFL